MLQVLQLPVSVAAAAAAAAASAAGGPAAAAAAAAAGKSRRHVCKFVVKVCRSASVVVTYVGQDLSAGPAVARAFIGFIAQLNVIFRMCNKTLTRTTAATH